MCDEEGELFIKPCVQAEVDFYQTVRRRHPDFAEIMPEFMGTLLLSDPADLSSIEEGVAGPLSLSVEAAAGPDENITALVAAQAEKEKDNVTWVPNKSKKIKTDLAVVLENAASGFKQPNILDVKLGVRLWADDAPLQKKQRFDKITSETTHRDYGFRIAGMRTYRGSKNSEELNAEGYKTYDKDYGRSEVNNHNIVDALRGFVFNEHAGVDEELGQAVCKAFVHEIQRVEEVLSKNQTRMYSSSLLLVFEGDGAALRQAIDENNAAVVDIEERAAEKAQEQVSRTAARIDSGIGMDDDFIEDVGFEGEESDGEPELAKVFAVKLIDFAHAKFVPGQGPDENTLKGVRSLAKIFEDLAR
jgi:1D-myo-inositol-tetrakisphosphate 5-kinase/inositol-polyphosphate multikinase